MEDTGSGAKGLVNSDRLRQGNVPYDGPTPPPDRRDTHDHQPRRGQANRSTCHSDALPARLDTAEGEGDWLKGTRALLVQRGWCSAFSEFGLVPRGER